MRVPRPSRWWQWTGLIVLVLFVAWLVFGYLVIGNPTVDHPRRADAVVVLGPSYETGRVDEALSLMRQQVASNLVVSIANERDVQVTPFCHEPQAGFKVTCFHPNPNTTRGEAEYVRDLARQHGWTSVVVVTSTYHISRARMIFERCLDGRLYMVAARRGMSAFSWAYQYVYQTAAYVKAALQSGC